MTATGRARTGIIAGACLSLAFASLIALPNASAAVADPTTQVSATLMESDGITPLADASVEVDYIPPATDDTVGATQSLQLLATATTDDQGNFTATLDTSGLSTADMGDIGDGTADSFNIDIIAENPLLGFQTVDTTTATLGTTSDDGTVATSTSTPVGTSTVTGAQADATDSVPQPTCAGLAPGSRKLVYKFYRYVPVTPMNVGGGMKATVDLNVTSSVTRQTQVSSYISYDGVSWAESNQHIEEMSRSVTAPWTESNSYHKWLWAYYEMGIYDVCPFDNPLNAYDETSAIQLQTTVTDQNADVDSKGNSIGQVTYNVPSFTPGNANQFWFNFVSQDSGWSRSTGNRVSNTVGNDFQLNLPIYGTSTTAFYGASSKVTYGSISKITYYWLSSGCGGTTERVIWGQNDAPTTTSRVQSNCFPDTSI